MPERVQMHRRKGGWRKDHPDAVIVARPTRWGNPFTVSDALDAGFRSDDLHQFVVDCFANWLRGDRSAWMSTDSDAAAETILARLPELRGRDLACWCPLDQPCHADVLLEIANREEERG